METIFNFESINLAIEWLVKTKMHNFRRVSEHCRIHPSYFSRALKAEASFSQLQIFRMSEFFLLNSEEQEYFFLLWNLQEASEQNEKQFFKRKIQAIQNKKEKVASRIKVPVISPEEQKVRIETYYSESVTAIVHMYLTIASYRKAPENILKHLPINKMKLQIELDKLAALDLIRIQNNKIIEVQHNIHLDEKSNISFSNHINWRLKSIQYLEQRMPRENDYHLSVAFSADDETKIKLRKRLRDLVVQAQSIVSECKDPDQVSFLMMDLF